MTIVIGDLVTEECQKVGKLPIRLLMLGPGDTLQYADDNVLSKIPLIAANVPDFRNAFTANGLEICNDNFGIQGYPLSLWVKKFTPPEGDYDFTGVDFWTNRYNVTFSGVFPPSLTRTYASFMTPISTLGASTVGRRIPDDVSAYRVALTKIVIQRIVYVIGNTVEHPPIVQSDEYIPNITISEGFKAGGVASGGFIDYPAPIYTAEYREDWHWPYGEPIPGTLITGADPNTIATWSQDIFTISIEMSYYYDL